jgi:1,2-diacylglycerol 3-alpha-glucosyltransferase
MRISLVDNRFLPLAADGGDDEVSTLARWLGRKNHEVLVLAAAQGYEPGEYEGDGFHIARISGVRFPTRRDGTLTRVNFTYSPGNFKRLRGLLDRFKPDLLHQYGFSDMTWMSGLWAWSRKCPTVLTAQTPLVQTHALPRLIGSAAKTVAFGPLMRIWSPRLVASDASLGDGLPRRLRHQIQGASVITFESEAEYGRAYLALYESLLEAK